MPISLKQRVPENAPGDFYVAAGTCLQCCLPHAEAPELMNDCKIFFRECYFTRQPQTPEEVEHAIQAIWVSELDCIRYGGGANSNNRPLSGNAFAGRHALPHRPPLSITTHHVRAERVM